MGQFGLCTAMLSVQNGWLIDFQQTCSLRDHVLSEILNQSLSRAA